MACLSLFGTSLYIAQAAHRLRDVVQLSRLGVYATDNTGQCDMMVSRVGIGQTHRLVVRDPLAFGALVSVLGDWANQ